MGKVILILGILGILLGGGIAVVSLLLPQVTRNVSGNEAMIGVVAGAAVLVLSFIPAIVGVIVLMMKRNKLKSQP